MGANSNPYYSVVMRTIPVILSKLDRDPTSPTYGCFDRLYWHYRIRDFVSMIEMQPVLALAMLYNHDFKGNIYYNNSKIREYAVAALNFWADHLHKDGSADEYWPNEHGYPPAVFPLFAVSETYRILGIKSKNLGIKSKKIVTAMLRTASFISKQVEKGPVNQEIASIAALYSVYLNTKNKKLLKIINKKLKIIKKLQNDEGWFPEYGGADPGYLSVALDYLAEYFRLSKDNSVKPIIGKILDFIQYFVHPDGTFGGDYGSRNTEYFLPNGLEILRNEFPIAGAIADKLNQNINTEKYIHNSIDDRYLGDYCTRSFTGALVNYEINNNHKGATNKNAMKQGNGKRYKKEIKAYLPYESKGERYFRHAGLLVKSTGKHYIIISMAKGGVIKVYDNKSILFSDCGYVAKIGETTRHSTNWLNRNYKILKDKDVFYVRGRFHEHKHQLQTPFKSFLIRIAAKFLGKELIPLMKKVMITGEKQSNIRFSREIRIENTNITITDKIKSKYRIPSLHSINRFSVRYVPSSKFFQLNDIIALNKERTYNKFKFLNISKEFNFIEKKEKMLTLHLK